MVCYVLVIMDEFTREIEPIMVYDSKEKARAGAFEAFKELLSVNGWVGITEETIEEYKRKFIEDLEEFDVAYVEDFETNYRIEQCIIN